MSGNISARPASQMGGLQTSPTIALGERLAMIGGRALVAMLFIVAGIAKIMHAGPYLEHMTRFDVPTVLLPAVIALELGAGLALLFGWRVRDAAGLLAVFCVMTATIFHHQLWISAELTSFFKDLAIAGGLFAMAANASALDRVRNSA